MSRRKSTKELKALVSWLRAYLGIEQVARPNMLPVLSKAQQLFRDFSYRRVPDGELPEGKEASHEEGEIRFADRTFQALERDESRARFTAAHEFAHYILRHPEVRFRGAQIRPYEASKRSVRVEESEANQFAALFLAPDNLIRETDTVSELIERFGISLRTAQIRKAEIDADQRTRRGELRQLPSKVIDFLTRQQKQGYRVTSLEFARRPSVSASTGNQPSTPDPWAAYNASCCAECGNHSAIRVANSLVCQICGYSTDPD